nr:5'-3' exonuclease-like isoform X4 [Ipomoea batatas]GMD75811.1 5'-3' exonuclease-like isoform X4 [Ipomoea batatas]GMD79272.1 5'-3' exonuclease-like isoform X4 [Ipomoea batatas]
MSILCVTRDAPLLCRLLLIGSPCFSPKSAIVTLLLLLLMGKELMSTAGNCCPHIKHIGRSSWVQLQKDLQQLKDHINSSWMFLRSAMCLLLNLSLMKQMML